MNYKNYLTTLKIIHAALTIGQIFFAAVLFYLNYTEKTTGDPSISTIMLTAVIASMGMGIAAGYFLFNVRIKQTRKKASLYEKLMDYRMALILRYALLEGPCLFSLIAYLLTASQNFFYLAIVIIVLFLTLAPTRSKLIADLALSDQEIAQLD